jgi:hypothetical protein
MVQCYFCSQTDFPQFSSTLECVTGLSIILAQAVEKLGFLLLVLISQLLYLLVITPLTTQHL